MKNLLVLGVDFETQGSDATKTNVTEIGAVLEELSWSETPPRPPATAPLPERRRIATFETLVYDSSYPPQTPEIVELTGITDEMLRAGEGVMIPKAAFTALAQLAERAEVLMAHNTAFDKTVYNSQVRLLGILPPERPWICTLTEVPYPQKFTCKKLGHLALDHGVPMDARELHRAVNDVELMFDLVLGKYHLADVLAYQAIPWVVLRADILGPWEGRGGDGGVGKGQATALGYSWETPRGTTDKYPKCWVKRVKENKVDEEIRLAPFRAVVVG
jgi:DNA polymerase III epsilon subunit-like protein